METTNPRTKPPPCPVRPGEPCMLCQPGGPESCGLVYLVMTDPELRAQLLTLTPTATPTATSTATPTVTPTATPTATEE